MPKTREQKKEILKQISEKISKSKSIVFTKFDALGVKENENLRQELKKENGEYLVAKKTLLGIAFKENEIEGFDPKELEGKVATIFGYADEVAPARIVDGFMKKNEGKMTFVGGILEGRYLNAEEVSALAKLPTKQELYAQLVGSLNAPISGFVNALAGNLKNFVYVLKAIEEKKSN
jgi:large subunit ribosomal protein L10